MCRSVSDFIAGAEILPDPVRSGLYLVGSVESRLDLDEISPDLAGSGGFHVDRSWKSKNIAGISHFLSGILQMSPDVVDLVGRVARVLGEETRQPNRRVRVLWVATCSRSSDWSVRVVAGRFRAGLASWSGDEDPWTLLVLVPSRNL